MLAGEDRHVMRLSKPWLRYLVITQQPASLCRDGLFSFTEYSPSLYKFLNQDPLKSSVHNKFRFQKAVMENLPTLFYTTIQTSYLTKLRKKKIHHVFDGQRNLVRASYTTSSGSTITSDADSYSHGDSKPVKATPPHKPCTVLKK